MLAILEILLYALITPKVGSNPGRARIMAAQGDISTGIKSAIDQFKMDNGYYPKSLQDLVQQPPGAKNWHGPYFNPPNLPIDPWGNNYIYECPGKHNTNSYDLMSVGPDGKIGTEDDIGNWTK
ncbi:MAG TPA: type II secretion system major pseudopilin GspG [Candidatus Aquilonibacter sp.]|nr:type II secretion system major pseudopilin GspG [Candidatus Aquilonibacter sp.]